MKKLLVVFLAALAVALFAVDFKFTWSGWMEQGFEFSKDGTLKYVQYGEFSFGGLYPSVAKSDFVFAINGVYFINNPTSWSNDSADNSKYVATAYVMYKPIDGLTISVGRRTFRSVYYDEVWNGEKVYNDIASNRLTVQYKYDFLTVTAGMFSTDTFSATDLRFLAQVRYNPVYVAGSYDVKTNKYALYAKLDYPLDSLGLKGYGVKADIRYADGTVTDGAVLAYGSAGAAEFGGKFNYHKLILGNPAAFGAWFNYTIDPKVEFKLKTYFETDTEFSYLYAMVAAPWKFSENLTATPKVEFNKDGFNKASFKFSYSF